MSSKINVPAPPKGVNLSTLEITPETVAVVIEFDDISDDYVRFMDDLLEVRLPESVKHRVYYIRKPKGVTLSPMTESDMNTAGWYRK